MTNTHTDCLSYSSYGQAVARNGTDRRHKDFQLLRWFSQILPSTYFIIHFLITSMLLHDSCPVSKWVRARLQKSDLVFP